MPHCMAGGEESMRKTPKPFAKLEETLLHSWIHSYEFLTKAQELQKAAEGQWACVGDAIRKAHNISPEKNFSVEEDGSIHLAPHV